MYSNNLRELVDGNDNLETEFLGILDMFTQVGTSLLQKIEVFFSVDSIEGFTGGDGRSTSVHLECSDGGDKDHSVRGQARNSSLDVAEFLHTDIGTESSFSDDITVSVLVISLLDTSELECDSVGNDG